MSSLITTARLRLSYCRELGYSKPLALQRRLQSVLAEPPAQDHQQHPIDQPLKDELHRLLARERQLDAIRSAFFPPGQAHLRFGSVYFNRVRDAPASALPSHECDLIANQLSRCAYPSDYFNLITSILAQKTASENYHVEGPRLVCDFLYQQLKADPACAIDTKILLLANQIRYKLEDANVALPESLIAMGLLSAAHSRSLPALRVYFHDQQKLNLPMAHHLFIELADSITRPPRRISTPNSWDRAWTNDHAIAALQDLSDFVPQDSYDCLARWLRALGRVKKIDWMRVERSMWVEREECKHPSQCPCPPVAKGQTSTPLRLQEEGLWNTKTRGDLLFIESFRKAHAIKEAWKVLENSNVPYRILRPQTQKPLMAHPEFAAPELWTEEMKDELKGRLLDNCAAELSKIEVVYGVKWVWDEKAGMGYHRLRSDLEDDG